MTSSEETLPVRFGPFLLLHVLGAGGMGKAYLGRHPDWEGRLVIKRMHAHFLEDQTIFKRFVHEAEVATYVRHSNIAQLVAMGTVGTEPFFATEHVFGVPISHLVHRLELGQTKPMPIGVALKIAIGLARGVEGIHDARDVDTGESLNLIHRDIGARNVLLGFDGRPVIIDLGLGKSMLADWQTAANVFAGSPDYMPPEQALGKRVDRRADVYAAAVTIWELVAGRKRIDEAHVPQRIAAAIDAQPEPLLEYRPDAPKGLERLLQHAMAPDPEQRTATATVLREGLEREWARISPRVQTSHVEDWLEASCATVIAKERRGLEESEALDYDFDVDHTDAQTQILAAQPIMFMPPSPPREPSRGDEPAPAPILVAADSAKDVGVRAISKLREVAMQLLDSYIKLPRRERHIVSAGLATLIVALIGVAALRRPAPTPPPDIVPLQVLPPPEPFAAAPPEPAIEIAPVAPTAGVVDAGASPSAATKARPRRPRRPRLPVEVREHKQRLVGRLRRLRRQRFDVSWQKELTRIGTKLSRARTTASLDRIEARITEMEGDD